MPPCKKVPAQTLARYWESSPLETNDIPQPASLFNHPKRGEKFPPLYLLNEQHPLRPQGFVSSTKTSFKDYVVAIQKTSDFMKDWQEVGLKTETPVDDVSSNLDNGMFPMISSIINMMRV